MVHVPKKAATFSNILKCWSKYSDIFVLLVAWNFLIWRIHKYFCMCMLCILYIALCRCCRRHLYINWCIENYSDEFSLYKIDDLRETVWVSSVLVKCKCSADAVNAICQPWLGQKWGGFCIVKYHDLEIGNWKWPALGNSCIYTAVEVLNMQMVRWKRLHFLL